MTDFRAIMKQAAWDEAAIDRVMGWINQATIEAYAQADAILKVEIEAMENLLVRRAEDLARCPRHPKGERCAMPIGHEGGCKWARGD